MFLKKMDKMSGHLGKVARRVEERVAPIGIRGGQGQKEEISRTKTNPATMETISLEAETATTVEETISQEIAQNHQCATHANPPITKLKTSQRKKMVRKVGRAAKEREEEIREVMGRGQIVWMIRPRRDPLG